MRTSQIRWQRGAMCIAVAAACASSVSVIGCARSSAREVGADLSKQASESAIRAERFIAARNESAADVEDASSEEPAGKVFLSGTSSKARQNPLAQLLKENSEQFPSEDPFLYSNRKQKDVVAQKSDDQIVLTQHSKDQRAQDSRSGIDPNDQSPIAKPFPTDAQPKTQSQATRNPFAAYKQQQEAEPTPTLATSKTSGSRIAKRLPKLAASPKLPAQQESPVTAVPTFRKDEAIPTLGQWKNVSEQPRLNPVLKSPVVQAPVQTKPVQPKEVPQEKNVEQFERMKSLILQAKNQHARGELHAAYRSALLAQNIVTKNDLKLGPNDANPTTIAQEIAAMIWGTNKQEESKFESETESDLPVIQPKLHRKQAKHNQTFTTSPAYLNWQAFPEEETEENPVVLTQGESSEGKVVPAHYDETPGETSKIELVQDAEKDDAEQAASPVIPRPMPQLGVKASEPDLLVEAESVQPVSPKVTASLPTRIEIENPFDIEIAYTNDFLSKEIKMTAAK